MITVSAENASANLKLAPSHRRVYIWFDNQTLGFQNCSVAQGAITKRRTQGGDKHTHTRTRDVTADTRAKNLL